MINENMKKVLVALRSGEYQQTQTILNDHCGHCCLGVMCDVYEKETGNKLKRDAAGYIKGHSFANLPEVQKWVGLIDVHGNIYDDASNEDISESLVYMNDTLGLTFLEIADFIETDPKGLLTE
jgi:hypothetical protein